VGYRSAGSFTPFKTYKKEAILRQPSNVLQTITMASPDESYNDATVVVEQASADEASSSGPSTSLEIDVCPTF
jgi:hypothetical protein